MKKTMSRENVDSLKDRLKKEPYFKIIEGIQIDSRQFETHPEAHHLRKYSWEGMLSISFETDSHTADNAVAEQRRNEGKTDSRYSIFRSAIVGHTSIRVWSSRLPKVIGRKSLRNEIR